MRITRLFVLLALAALLAPRAEAARTSVWESNPPSSMTATKSDAAGLLAALAPAAAGEIEAEEPPPFDLGDVVLVERELAREERFDLGPLTLVDLNLLRGPPPSYPETRVRGFELLPPFRVGASPSLSLWSPQACGFSCREVVSDSRYDPWGLRALNQQDKERIREFNDEARRLRGLLTSGAKNKKEIDEALDEVERMRHSFVEAVRAAREDQPILAQQAPASVLDPRQVTRYGPQPSTQEVEDRNRDAYKWKFWTVDVPTTATVFAMPHVVNAGPRIVEAQANIELQPQEARLPPLRERLTYLYEKVGPNGEHLKYGITADPTTRYTGDQLGGGRLKLIAAGTRAEMLKLERELHGNLPIGPEERQPQYIEMQQRKGLQPPPYTEVP